MYTDEQYSLNWRDYLHHIKKSFDSLLRDNDFADVTLSCQGKKLKAHKMILSACSTYFHDLLRDNPCPHPIIILQGVEHEHVANILQFMYKGEVQVPTEGFNKFLKTAELLEISGLIDETKTDNESKHANKRLQVVEREKSQRVRPGPASKKLEWMKELEMKKELEEKSTPRSKRPSDSDSDDERHKKKFVGNGGGNSEDLSLKAGESSGSGQGTVEDVQNNCVERNRSKPGPASKKLEWKKRDEVEEWLCRTDKLSLQTKQNSDNQRDGAELDVMEADGKDEEDDEKSTEADNTSIIETEIEDMNDDQLSNPGTASNDDYLNERLNPNYECPVCGWKCVDMQKLKQHVRYHSRETKCRLCGKVFSRIELLHQHEMIVHEVF